MTPAVKQLQAMKIPHDVHSYQHHVGVKAYGLEASEQLNLPAEQVFKTLVVMLDSNPKHLAVGIVPVAKQLDLKAMASACHAKKAEMAPTELVERVTGYVIGGVSPIGQKKSLMTILDQSSMAFSNIFVSGGRRGLEIALTPQDLLLSCHAQLVKITR